MALDRDWQIRLAAMQKMDELRKQGGGLVRTAQLDRKDELSEKWIARYIDQKPTQGPAA